MKLEVGKEYECIYCGFRAKKGWGHNSLMNIDHFMPKDKFPGQKKNQANLVISCVICNIIKGNKIYQTLEEARKQIALKKERKPEMVNQIIKTYKLPIEIIEVES